MGHDEFTLSDGLTGLGQADNAAAAVLVSELFPPAVGGTPVLFEAIYSRLNMEVIVVADGPGGSAAIAPAGRLSVIRRPMATRHWGVADRAGLAQHLSLLRALRKIAVHPRAVVHCGRALPEGVAAWANRGLGGPRYICWSHGEDIAGSRQSREHHMLVRRVSLGASANLANSRNTARMIEELGVPASRIHVVYPGVDVQRFRPDVDGSALRARHAPAGGVVLLSVGRLQRRKGHDLAIEALARLDQALPITYLIAGDGAERARLEELAAQLGQQHRVRFLGEVAADDLPRYYAACDIFVLPNREADNDVEGFGIVFLEAAATGRPTIGGRSGGVPEAVADQVTGVLVGGTDADELAAAILQLVASQELRRAMGAAGRARACQDFSWESAAAQVRQVHLEVAAMGRRRW